MARNQPSKRKYLRELDRLEPALRKEYFRWVASRVESISVSDLERMVRSGDVEGIVELIDVDQTIGEVTEQIRDTYKAGGQFEAPATQVEFNMRNPRAEAWLASDSSRFVTNITEGERANVQRAVAGGMERGQNPRQTALDIVGRRSGVTGRRKGGLIGLSGPQGEAVEAARSQLSSGDPSEMRKYLNKQRRDKRYDAMVKRAIRDGRPLTKAEVNKIVGRYSDRLLQLRGETIARTESVHAFNAAREESWQQAYQSGKTDPRYVTKTWSATMDNKVRDTHASLNRDQKPAREPFRTSAGNYLNYPGDTSMGAPPEEIINCRCYVERRVDYLQQAADIENAQAGFGNG